MPFAFVDEQALVKLKRLLDEHRQVSVVGLPGCGKSTWIRERLLRQQLLGAPLQSADEPLLDRAYVWLRNGDVEPFLNNARCLGVIRESATPLLSESLIWVASPPVQCPDSVFPQSEPIAALQEWRLTEQLDLPRCRQGTFVVDLLECLPLFAQRMQRFVQTLEPAMVSLLSCLAYFPGPWLLADACQALASLQHCSTTRAQSDICRLQHCGLLVNCRRGGVDLLMLAHVLHGYLQGQLVTQTSFAQCQARILDVIEATARQYQWQGQLTPPQSTPLPMDLVQKKASSVMYGLAAAWSRFFPFPKSITTDLDVQNNELLQRSTEFGTWLYAVAEYGDLDTAKAYCQHLTPKHPWRHTLCLVMMEPDAYKDAKCFDRSALSRKSAAKSVAASTPVAALPIFYYAVGRMQVFKGTLDDGLKSFERALELCHDDPCLEAFVLSGLGFALLNQGHTDAARARLEQAERLAKAYGFLSVSARVAGYLGNLERRWGSFEKADAYYQKAISSALSAGDLKMAGVFAVDRLILALDRQQTSALEKQQEAERLLGQAGSSGWTTPMAWLLDGYAQLFGKRFLKTPDEPSDTADAYHDCNIMLGRCVDAVERKQLSQHFVDDLNTALADPWQHKYHAARIAKIHLARHGLLSTTVLVRQGTSVPRGHLKSATGLSGQSQGWLVDGHELRLESEVLDLMLRSLADVAIKAPGHYLPTDALADAVWGQSAAIEQLRNRLKVNMVKLRRLLPKGLLQSQRGAGYRIDPAWTVVFNQDAAAINL